MQVQVFDENDVLTGKGIISTMLKAKILIR